MQGFTAAQRTPEAAARIHLRVHLWREQLLQCRQELPARLFGLDCPLPHHSCARTVLCHTTAVPGLSPATPQPSQGCPGLGLPAVSTAGDGSAPAQPSLPCPSPALGGWRVLVSTLAVCPALCSPQEAPPSLAVTVMWLLGLCENPGKEINLGETVITSVRLIN